MCTEFCFSALVKLALLLLLLCLLLLVVLGVFFVLLTFFLSRQTLCIRSTERTCTQFTEDTLPVASRRLSCTRPLSNGMWINKGQQRECTKKEEWNWKTRIIIYSWLFRHNPVSVSVHVWFVRSFVLALSAGAAVVGVLPLHLLYPPTN